LSPRRKAASAGQVARQASQHLERSEAWNGLKRGDPVIVSGLAIRGADWEFRAHVLNRNNGTESVEVVGGRPGDHTVRSFEPRRIYAVTSKLRVGGRTKASKAIAGELSVAEAPRLPLG
jgi:hypothetical protein